jgi:hypothetical protein
MRPRFSETHFYLLAFCLALAVRLLNLGAFPLADHEAQWAMQAYDLSRGTVEIGAQPGYVMLTGLLLTMLHATNALARLVPALLGSLIVFFPALLRMAGGRLDFPRNAAIVLAFGLAVDPTLTVLSRQAGSNIPAVVCLALAGAALYAGRPILAGVLGGLALLGGPAVFIGALGLGLAYGLIVLLQKADWLAPLGNRAEAELPPNEESPTPRPNTLRQALLTLAITTVTVATIFLAYPLGLSGLAASLTSFLSGWSNASLIAPTTPLAALLAYESLPLLFGLVGIYLAWRQREVTFQWLSLWLLVALLLALLYPAHHISDIAWMLIPLWTLAAWALAETWQPAPEDQALRPLALLHATFLFILFAVWRMNILGLRNYGFSITPLIQNITDRISALGLSNFGTEQTLGLLLSAGVLAMAAIATLMVGFGWSVGLARQGMAWAVTAAGALSLLAATFWGSQMRPASTYELWDTPPAVGQVDLVIKTVQHLSNAHTGIPTAIDIVSTVDTPSLRWALRDFPNTQFVAQLAVTEQPAIVITRQDDAGLQSSSSYLGQDFAWEFRPAWVGALPPDWLPWLAFRDAPLASSSIILWARGDLFPAAIVEE